MSQTSESELSDASEISELGSNILFESHARGIRNVIELLEVHGVAIAERRTQPEANAETTETEGTPTETLAASNVVAENLDASENAIPTNVVAATEATGGTAMLAETSGGQQPEIIEPAATEVSGGQQAEGNEPAVAESSGGQGRNECTGNNERECRLDRPTAGCYVGNQMKLWRPAA